MEISTGMVELVALQVLVQAVAMQCNATNLLE